MARMARVRERIVNKRSVTTYTVQFSSANILEVEVGTTGFCGGDTGHGARTYFRLEDLGGTDITVKEIKGGVVIEFGGDTEIDTFISALEYAATVLKTEVEYTKEEQQ